MYENVRLLSKRQRRRKVTQSVEKILRNVNTVNSNSNVLHHVNNLSPDVCFNIGNNDIIHNDDDMPIDNVKKKLLEQYNDGKDSDTSQSSDSEVVRSKTAKNQKKHKNAKSMSKDSDSSKLLAVSKNKQKQNRFDREITENININIQSNKSLETVFIDRTENGNPISVSEGENNSTEILSTQQFQKYVIKRFEEIMVLLEQSNASFARLLNSVQTYMNPTSKPDGFPDLPLTTDDEFQKLEVMLSEKAKDDPNGQQIATLAYTYLKGRLSTIGGADQRSCVMNMLKFLMTNQLAMSYNWKGQHNKKSFEITKLREVIMEAAKIQFRGKESSDTAIKDAIQSWLKLAKNRHAYSSTKK